MSIEIVFLYASITILSLVLLLVTLLGHMKHHNTKLLIISAVFLFFFIRGLLLSISLFNETIATITSSGYIWAVDLIILLFLFLVYSIKR